MSDKTMVTRRCMSNNKEIKVNLTYNKMSQESAKIFVNEVTKLYNNDIMKNIKKVG